MNIKKPLPISLVSLLEHSPLLVASFPSFLASNENVSGTAAVMLALLEASEAVVEAVTFALLASTTISSAFLLLSSSSRSHATGRRHPASCRYLVPCEHPATAVALSFQCVVSLTPEGLVQAMFLLVWAEAGNVRLRDLLLQ